MKACGLPVDIGDGPVKQAQLEKLWISDRLALLDCARRHKALADFIKRRDAALSGVTK